MLIKVIAGLLLASLMALPAPAETRIGTVDLRKVFDNYWKTKQADAALKDRAAEMEKQNKDLVEDWKKAREAYQTLLGDANNQALSAEERDKRKKAAEEKLRQVKETEDTITQFQRTAKETIDTQRKRMRDTIVDEIRNVLNAKARAAGYSMVVDISAESFNATPIILFTSNETDMTNELLAQLNATSTGDAPKAPDSKTSGKK
jgi:outer membrane protein